MKTGNIMSKPILGLWGLLAAFLLAACFGENPTNGAEIPADPKASAQRTLDSAQTLMNHKKFAEAMACYERAIALDSSLSQAYYGYATAVSFRYGIKAAGILEDLEAAGAGNLEAFLDHPDSVLTQRLHAAHRITRMLDVLVNRDTLSTAANPLTDGKVTFAKVGLDLALFKLLYFLSRVHDIDRNDTLDFRDRVYFNLMPGGNLGGLSEHLKTDTLLQSAVNDKILDLQNGMTDLQSLLDNLHPSDTGSAQHEAKNHMDSAVASLGGTLTFYQFGDHKDNDGDGCIDEEFIDSLDNDLDGFVDEDARLLNGTGAAGSPADGVDNDHNGKMDAAEAGENRFGANPAPHVLTFVVLSGQGDNWVKIKKDAANMDVRLSIQKDSLSLPSRAALPDYAAKLNAAKTQVGGCWRNYP
jgi:hypothetical protein